MCCNKSLHKQHNIVFFSKGGQSCSMRPLFFLFFFFNEEFIFIASKADRYCNDCLTLI